MIIDVSDALKAMLPDRAERLFMQCCVMERAELQQAWEEWQDCVGEPLRWLAADGKDLRGHLPLLYRNLTLNDISISRTFQSHLRAATFRTKRRYRIYEQCVNDVIDIIQDGSLEPTFVRGSALTLAELLDKPFLRHRHDLDIHVNADDQEAMERLLRAHGYLLAWAQRGTTRLIHEKGLPVTLHSRLLDEPLYSVPIKEFDMRRELCSTAAGPVHIFSVPDRLIHVLAHAASRFRRLHNNWIVDSCLIIRGMTLQDWEKFLDTCKRAQLGLPLYVLGDFLSTEFKVGIPTDVLKRLKSLSVEADREQRFAAIQGARLGRPGGLRRLLSFGRVSAKLVLAREVLLPPHRIQIAERLYRNARQSVPRHS